MYLELKVDVMRVRLDILNFVRMTSARRIQQAEPFLVDDKRFEVALAVFTFLLELTSRMRLSHPTKFNGVGCSNS